MKTDQFTLGILAHVDAGKTTLAENFLYYTGKIRRIGRVDHGDAFFDNFEMERQRGITIFSKSAILQVGNRRITLLDTPGHADFTAETERAVSAMDYAVLLISAADGVQSHTRTLWHLLRRYRVPVFLFVNKMDREDTDRKALLQELQKELSENCLDFTDDRSEAFFESAALCDEAAMDLYLENGKLTPEEISALIQERKLFPCFFGSALKGTGVQEFFQGVFRYADAPDFPDAFGARVYKIARDERGERLTFLKITGGTLRVRDQIRESLPVGESDFRDLESENRPASDIPDKESERGAGGEPLKPEPAGRSFKISQIRIYSGSRFETVQEVSAGCICAVTGISDSRPGQGFGAEKEAPRPAAEAVMSYQLIPPADANVHEVFLKLQQLEEEEPQLHLEWKDNIQEIHVHLMGEVQTQVLRKLISDRFGMDVDFGPGNVVYKETVSEPTAGIGHFEPLRHYAEVHVLLEPGERGSGIVCESRCSTDVFGANWQRLVLSHLREKKHIGVLTGSELTDVKITLLAGRAHIKHSGGADFREAAWRAVRNALMLGKSLLLEPYYSFSLEIPSASVGRAMTDLQARSASFGQPQIIGDRAEISGRAPAAMLEGYAAEVMSYSGGLGQLRYYYSGYDVCHNQEEVVSRIGYDPEADLENPASSIFCEHGAGIYVGWDQVKAHAHIRPDQYSGTAENPEGAPAGDASVPVNSVRKTGGQGQTVSAERSTAPSAFSAEDKELEEIFARTYRTSAGKTQARRLREMQPVSGKSAAKGQTQREKYLLVDGYNIIFAWSDLTELSQINLDSARQELMDVLSNYQGYLQAHLILVFDAYKVKGGVGSVTRYHNIDVVFTREAETADAYIEKVTHELGKKYDVTVATSDGLEQMIIWGHGAKRLSAQELKADIKDANIEIADFLASQTSEKDRLFDHLDQKDREKMENIRLGKENFTDGGQV